MWGLQELQGTGRVALGCKESFLDGMFLLYTLPYYLLAFPCSLTPGHTALKLAGALGASVSLRAFAEGFLCQCCIRGSVVEQAFRGSLLAGNPEAQLGAVQHPGTVF